MHPDIVDEAEKSMARQRAEKAAKEAQIMKEAASKQLSDQILAVLAKIQSHGYDLSELPFVDAEALIDGYMSIADQLDTDESLQEIRPDQAEGITTIIDHIIQLPKMSHEQARTLYHARQKIADMHGLTSSVDTLLRGLEAYAADEDTDI